MDIESISRDVIQKVTAKRGGKYALKQDAIAIHHSVGRYIRNEFDLWNQESPIVEYFKKTYDIDHADDISAMLTKCAQALIAGETYDPEPDVKSYKEHWAKMIVIEED